MSDEASRRSTLRGEGARNQLIDNRQGAGDGIRTRDNLLGKQELYH